MIILKYELQICPKLAAQAEFQSYHCSPITTYYHLLKGIPITESLIMLDKHSDDQKDYQPSVFYTAAKKKYTCFSLLTDPKMKNEIKKEQKEKEEKKRKEKEEHIVGVHVSNEGFDCQVRRVERERWWRESKNRTPAATNPSCGSPPSSVGPTTSTPLPPSLKLSPIPSPRLCE